MRMGLITFGLVVIVAVAVVCLPGHSSFGHGWKQAFTSLTKGFRGTQTTLSKLGGSGISDHYISYNDPRVRSTMDIPWARN